MILLQETNNLVGANLIQNNFFGIERTNIWKILALLSFTVILFGSLAGCTEVILNSKRLADETTKQDCERCGCKAEPSGANGYICSECTKGLDCLSE